ncbi:kelch-like protein 2 [Montipora capricornis]|uniref:kelch-like protein 2 n=1 Tax=Montipora capricornis TaxID=246305 RepID=UPI0035F20BAC
MESTSNVFYDFTDEQGAGDALKKMNDFRMEKSFCDVVLSTEDGAEFNAHRLVLASVSAYFRAMFLTDMRESTETNITIRGVESQSLRNLIDFAYTSTLRITFSNVHSLLSAASLLEFLTVENACYDFLRNSINVHNSLEIWNLADLHGCTELQSLSENFIRANFAAVLKLSDFNSLSVKQLAALLSHDKLNVPCESVVLFGVLDWVKHDLNNRLANLEELMEHIRFPLMTRKFLMDTAAREELIMGSATCREFVLEAIDYHLIPERRTKNRISRAIPRERLSRLLYVVGGEENRKVLNNVEYFDFNERKWRVIAPMIIPRKFAGSAILDGLLYAVGGVNREYADLVTVESYNPCVGQWTSVASLNKCKGALALSVLEGWLYAAGGSHNGSALKSVERYDASKNEWTQVANMRLPRSHFGMASLHGRLYAVGGHCGFSEIEHVECFDPMTNKWCDVSSMNKSRMNHAVVTFSDRLYVIGGSNSVGILDSIEKYNPDLNLWLIIRNTMDPRSGAAAAVVLGGEDGAQELFIIGGHDNHHRDTNTVKKLNLKFADYSTAVAPCMNHPRVYASVACV